MVDTQEKLAADQALAAARREVMVERVGLLQQWPPAIYYGFDKVYGAAVIREINAMQSRLVEDMDMHMISPELMERLSHAEGIAPVPQPRRTAVATVERPTAAPFRLPPVVPNDEYLEAAAAIGLNSGPVMQARMERFFVDRGWLVFGFDRVMAYLNRLCQKQMAREAGGEGRPSVFGPWADSLEPAWIPLRDMDRKRRGPTMKDKVYDQVPPLHAIQKVRDMETHFGEGVLSFAVSAIEREPDPFLAVCAKGTPMYVVDVWDEPGFGC